MVKKLLASWWSMVPTRAFSVGMIRDMIVECTASDNLTEKVVGEAKDSVSVGGGENRHPVGVGFTIVLG